MAEKNFPNEFAALDKAVGDLKAAAGRATLAAGFRIVAPANGFTIPVNGTLQCQASGPCKWTCFGATITDGGLLTAPDKPGIVRVTAAATTPGGITVTVDGKVVEGEQTQPQTPATEPTKAA